LDAFVFFLPLSALVLIAVVLLYFLPATLWALRTDRRGARLRAAKAGICLLAAVSIYVTINAQIRMADGRAVKLGDACLAYRVKYHHYPEDLKALVPEFISSIPAPRYSLLLLGDDFSYSPAFSLSLDDPFSYDLQKEPMLYYRVPFGYRFYHMESRKWGYWYLD
jgi:hypothetical protein